MSTKFTDLNLSARLLEALDSIGFKTPTPIQSKAIPVLSSGKDLLACAQTGSGKTGAYLLPMLEALLADPKIQGLVLAPTRELAQQISDFLQSLIPESKDFHTVRLVGGQDIRKQFKSLQRKPRLIVATPGRLIDHLKRNTVQIHKVAHLVLDEGDRMIDMGFAPQLDQILKYLPPQRQTAFFTATLDKKVTQLAQKYLHQPERLILDQSKPVAKIKQTVVQVEVKQKFDRILDELNARRGSVIIFLKTKRRTDQLTNHLSSYGYSVDRLHGGCSQGNRNRAISSFKDGKTRILCATDVAARGIDVPHVEHVINFDLPMMDDDYVHRVGRTGRNGASGEAVSFVTAQEHGAWNRLVKKFEIPESFIGQDKQARPEGGKPHGKKKSKFRRFGRNRQRQRPPKGEHSNRW